MPQSKKSIKASQIAKFLKAELYGQDLVVKKPVPIYDLAENCLSFVKKEFFSQSLIDIINKNPSSLVICSSQFQGKIKSSFIVVDEPYYEFSRVLKNFFDCPKPKIVIGKNCRLKPTVILGGSGFGYQKNNQDIYEVVTHIGGVRIGDNVDIGSWSAIDRGVLIDTRVGSNVKIDNLVQIGHNCQIGDGTIIAAGVVLAGGVVVGRNCFIGINACVKEKTKIGDNAFIGMGAVVVNDVPSGAKVFGNPARIIEKY